MKAIVFPVLAALLAAAAHGQAVKPGSIAPLVFEATITTENPPVNVTLPNNAGVRSTYSVSSVRYTNREILEAMRVASLLDGSLTGWSIRRLANAAGVGNLYAIKLGKTAVAVPANLLTQPVVQGVAATGTQVTPTTGVVRPNLMRRIYAGLNVRNGASTASGNQALKSAILVTPTGNFPVVTETDQLTVVGRSGSGSGVLSGSYRISRVLPANLTPLLPGAAVP